MFVRICVYFRIKEISEDKPPTSQSALFRSGFTSLRPQVASKERQYKLQRNTEKHVRNLNGFTKEGRKDSFAVDVITYVMLRIFIQDIASSVLRVNCYQRGSCVGGSSAFSSPFKHNIRPLDNQPPSWFIDIALKLALS